MSETMINRCNLPYIYNFHLDQNGSPSVGVSNVDIPGIFYL